MSHQQFHKGGEPGGHTPFLADPHIVRVARFRRVLRDAFQCSLLGQLAHVLQRLPRVDIFLGILRGRGGCGHRQAPGGRGRQS